MRTLRLELPIVVLVRDMVESLRHVTERDFLSTVVEMAEAYGWLVHHVLEQQHFAKRIGPGYPDLTLVSQPPRKPRIIFAELKREGAKPTDAQKEWLDAVGRCTFDLSPVEVYLWYPHDLETIEGILTAGGN